RDTALNLPADSDHPPFAARVRFAHCLFSPSEKLWKISISFIAPKAHRTPMATDSTPAAASPNPVCVSRPNNRRAESTATMADRTTFKLIVQALGRNVGKPHYCDVPRR